MNSQHKAIRTLLQTMAPKRAIAYVESFELPAEEELYVIQCDIKRNSQYKVAMDNNTSIEVVKRRKMSAYAHISDAINHTN